MTGFTSAVRAEVMMRDEGRCQRCHGIGSQVHHRAPRGMGGHAPEWVNHPDNLVFVCLTCHRWIEENREDATRLGWLVSRHEGHPEEVVLTRLDGSSFGLDDRDRIEWGHLGTPQRMTRCDFCGMPAVGALCETCGWAESEAEK